MPARETEPLIRAHIWLYERDWEELKDLFAATTGPSKAVRAMVRASLRSLRARGAAQARSHIVEQIQSAGADPLAGLDLPDEGGEGIE